MDNERRTIDSLRLVNFTAFKDLTMEFSPGINAIIGENATGKTHVLKVLYFACSLNPEARPQKVWMIDQVFPRGNYSAPYITRDKSLEIRARIELAMANFTGKFRFEFWEIDSDNSLDVAGSSGTRELPGGSLPCIFIQAKAILSHAEGFRSLYQERHIRFDTTYQDTLSKAQLNRLKLVPPEWEALRDQISAILGGEIDESNEVFYVVGQDKRLVLDMVAEGHHKFALLWLMINNGTLQPGTVLFWDEPESNLNPKLMIELVKILLRLEQMGVQIFFTTHDYIMLKYLDLLRTEENKVCFHSLYRDKEGEIATDRSHKLIGLEHNAIFDVFEDIYKREMKRAAEYLKHGK